MKLKDKVGMAGPQSTQTRFVEIHYTSLCLLFSIIMRLLMIAAFCIIASETTAQDVVKRKK